MKKTTDPNVRDVIIVGGGLAGLSAAIYLGRSRRDTLLIHSGRSMAKWELDVQNYLGFPEGIDGNELLTRGTNQVSRYGVEIAEDDIRSLLLKKDIFHLCGDGHTYQAKRVLLATGLTHLPPDIPGVRECLGRSLFFCKDCDAYRVRGKRIIIIGRNNEAAEYALAMLLFSPSVMICMNGRQPSWDSEHEGWLREYRIAVRPDRICAVEHSDGWLQALTFEQGEPVKIDAVFTTRGDVYHSDLAESAGAALDPETRRAMEQQPWLADVLAMRRWDDAAKVSGTSVPPLCAYRDLLEGCFGPQSWERASAVGNSLAACPATSAELNDSWRAVRAYAPPESRFDERVLEQRLCEKSTVGRPLRAASCEATQSHWSASATVPEPSSWASRPIRHDSSASMLQ